MQLTSLQAYLYIFYGIPYALAESFIWNILLAFTRAEAPKNRLNARGKLDRVPRVQKKKKKKDQLFLFCYTRYIV